MALITAPTYETAAAAIQHRDDCPDPDPRRTVGTEGDTIARCRNCQRFVVVVPGTARPRPVMPFRCREHPEQEVDARGKGCPDCQQAQRDREARRVEQRAKRARQASPGWEAYA